MTDWLSEMTRKWSHFDYYHKHYVGEMIPSLTLADEMFGALDGAYEDNERMARVLRELAENIKLEGELPMSYATEEAAEESWNAACALSDDAKELLK